MTKPFHSLNSNAPRFFTDVKSGFSKYYKKRAPPLLAIDSSSEPTFAAIELRLAIHECTNEHEAIPLPERRQRSSPADRFVRDASARSLAGQMDAHDRGCGVHEKER